ncbi:MAG: glutathione S-transferase family protein [Parvularculales bacterium]
MVELAEFDVLTREVLHWQGLHLFHFSGSSCSQKLRIYVRLKNIELTLHPVNLVKRENQTDWYMGINPRGLVPTLIDDGKVIIESNDIITYLENKFPTPELIPDGQAEEVSELLDFEDRLHMDLRAITMRFFVPSAMAQRSDEQLAHYEKAGSGQVCGRPDDHKAGELAFWQDMKAHNGIPDARAQAAVTALRTALETHEATLRKQPYLLGNTLSVVDIAWYIYANRLIGAGYPLATLHPHVGAWFDGLHKRPLFRNEVKTPLPVKLISAATRLAHRAGRRHIQTFIS